MLVERNGVPVDASEPPLVLDFGERLFVEVAVGCQRFSGFAAVRGDRILFSGLDFDPADCSAGDLLSRVFVDRFEWRVAFDDDGLLLSEGDTWLVFKREDWR